MAISLNDNEMEAMRGLPHFLVALYVMAIRPRMDFKTATVGNRPRISYQAIGEWLYIEPKQGRVDSGSPHKSAIRRAISQLEKVGLIRSIGNDESLVFRLPLANADNCARKKPDTNPTHHPDTLEAMRGVAFRDEPDTITTQKPDTHQISDLYTHRPPQHNTVASTESSPVVVEGLIFPAFVKPKAQQEICKLLTSMQTPAESWQVLIDEMHGAHNAEKQRGRGGIDNPVGFVRRLAQKLKSGEFTQERGDEISQARARRATQQAEIAERDQKPVLQEKSAAEKATLAAQAIASFKSAKAKAGVVAHV